MWIPEVVDWGSTLEQAITVKEEEKTHEERSNVNENLALLDLKSNYAAKNQISRVKNKVSQECIWNDWKENKWENDRWCTEKRANVWKKTGVPSESREQMQQKQ